MVKRLEGFFSKKAGRFISKSEFLSDDPFKMAKKSSFRTL